MNILKKGFILLILLMFLGCEDINVIGSKELFVGQKVHLILHKGDDFVDGGLVLVDSVKRAYTTTSLDDYRFISPKEQTFRIPSKVAIGNALLKISNTSGSTYQLNILIDRGIVYPDVSGIIHIVGLSNPKTEISKIDLAKGMQKLGSSDLSYIVPIFISEVGYVTLLSFEEGKPSLKNSSTMRKTGNTSMQIRDAAALWSYKKLFVATDSGLFILEPSGSNSFDWSDPSINRDAISVKVNYLGDSNSYVVALIFEDLQLTPYFSSSEGNTWSSSVALPSGETFIDMAFEYPYLAIITKKSNTKNLYLYNAQELSSGYVDMTTALTSDGNTCANPAKVEIIDDRVAILCGGAVYVITLSDSAGSINVVDLPDVANSMARGERNRIYIILADGTIGYLDLSSDNPKFISIISSYIKASQFWIQH